MIEAFHRFRATGKAEGLRSLARILAVDNQNGFFRWLRKRKFFFDEGGWIQAKAAVLTYAPGIAGMEGVLAAVRECIRRLKVM